MNGLWLDLRFGIRILLARPALTIVALFALALGIGANTALFSILYAVLWKPFPFPEAERLVIVWEKNTDKDMNVVSPGNYLDWKAQNRVFEDIAAFAQTSFVNLTGGGMPEQVSIQYASPNLFRVLGTRPALGRDFHAKDGTGEDRTVILSHNLWTRRYGADPSIVGKDILTNSRKARVVGVMPKNWNWFVREGSMFGKPPELWMAFPIVESLRKDGRYLTTVARLKPGVSVKEAQANLTLIAEQLAQQRPVKNAGWSTNVVPLRQQFSGNLRKPLWVLSGAVVFVLLIACTNVANLMLARALSRHREMAVRSALGAKRRHLIRQLLTESVLLSLEGGAAGIAIAVWGTELLSLLATRAGLDLGNVTLNLPVLIFALVLSVLTGIVFGIVPAAVASKLNVSNQLKEGSRGSSSLHTGRLRNALVVLQLTTALVLLAGAMLLIQSFSRLTNIDPGFDAQKVLTFKLVLPMAKYPEDSHRIQLFRNVVERMQSLPGVTSAGMTSFLPFSGPPAGTSFHIQGLPNPPPGQDRMTNVFVTDDSFFHTLRIPLKQGRLYSRAEMEQRKDVVVINEALARTYFPGENPIGRKITIDMRYENVPSEIIGIVGDMKQQQLDQPVRPSVYWPHPELTYSFMTIVMRTAGKPMDVAPLVRDTIQQIDRDQPIADLRTLKDWLGDSTARVRFNMILLSILAGIALVLAAAGLYGVMSHAVVQRTQELGIRMALGASRRDVFTLVLKEGSRILLIGSLIGFCVAIALTRLMQSMLYNTSNTNPVAYAVVFAVLICSGLIACWVPSRRASRVSPIEALRYE